MNPFQVALYESLAPFGPQLSALWSGFAVLIGGELFLTPAGKSYLESLDRRAAAP